jgi:hypothetical protein
MYGANIPVQIEQNHPLGAAQMGKVRVHGCSHLLARSVVLGCIFHGYSLVL